MIAALVLLTERERKAVLRVSAPESSSAGEPPPAVPPRERHSAPPDASSRGAVRGTDGEAKPGPRSGGRGPLPEPVYRIAVIIDDVGYPSTRIERFADFRGKLTFSVLPSLPNSSSYARLLHERGHEIMLHIPMEPEGYPGVDPGPQAILKRDERRTVEGKLLAMIEQVPFAAGANNHMGSRLTRDRGVMEWTMDILKGRNLYFIDSMTTPSSSAYALAVEKRVPSARRDVFLDNTDAFQAVNSQFEALKRVARTRGSAIGIGHVHRANTIEVLERQLPLLDDEGYVLVFVSELLGVEPRRR